MDFRRHHPQPVAAAKAGFSERTGRRIETAHHLPPPHVDKPRSRRRTADPFLGLWDGEIRPMLEVTPGLRPVTLLEEMQRRYPDHDWDRLRRSLERRVRAWSAEHGTDREVIFRQDHVPGQQALSDFTDMGDVGVSVAGQALDHRLYHFVLAFRLGACRAGARGRELHGPRGWSAERVMDARRRARRTSFRQPVRRLPQSR